MKISYNIRFFYFILHVSFYFTIYRNKVIYSIFSAFPIQKGIFNAFECSILYPLRLYLFNEEYNKNRKTVLV